MFVSPADHDSPAQRVLIAGGGVAALETAVALESLAGNRIRMRIVAPDTHFAWRALGVGESLGAEVAHRHALSDIALELGAELVHGELAAVDGERMVARVRSGEELPYDVLVLAVGAKPVAVVDAGGTFDRSSAGDVIDETIDALRSGFAESLLVVVPEGVAWTLPAYELAMLSAAATGARVTIATHESGPMRDLFGERASRVVARTLEEAGIEMRARVRADVVTDGAARLDGNWVTADRIVALPGFDGPALDGIPSDERGFILTDSQHRVVGLEGSVYAVGDGTTHPIKHGGLAARAADRVAARIAVDLGSPVREDVGPPVVRGLLSTPVGPLFLTADLRDPDTSGLASTRALWWPPTKVAAPWLGSFLTDLEGRRLAATA